MKPLLQTNKQTNNNLFHHFVQTQYFGFYFKLYEKGEDHIISNCIMTLQGEDHTTALASIAVHAILNWTLIHL